MARTAKPKDLPYCDIVMKGGITSGVVYPLAVVELHEKYRIKSVGGTSAGALAAAIVAAAEYARASGGYERIAALPEEIARVLFSLFQPGPEFRPLYDAFTGAANAKSRTGGVVSGLISLFSGYPGAWVPWTLPGLAVVLGGLLAGPGWLIVLGVVLALAGAVYGLFLKLKRLVFRDLPACDFGICPGLRQEGYEDPALTEWLADKIDEVAGLESAPGDGDGRPLTFGDLARDAGTADARPDGKKHPSGHDIALAVMTTDLMSRRPYRLPFRQNIHFFSKSEFEELFPPRVVTQLVGNREPRNGGPGVPDDLYPIPPASDLPVVVAARMSLSFPGLIRAVPLWKQDYTRKDPEDGTHPMIRCLFTDGGLSSNFPIHFFDRLLPRWPTFAIALQPFHEERHSDEKRAWMNPSARSGQLLPMHEISGVLDFLMTLLDAAKDWQDNMQSTLPGYRERIAHIALKADEGGLNLDMDDETIRNLIRYGAEAGGIITSARTKGGFDFDDHRWRRLLVAMSRLEEELVEFAEAWTGDGDLAEPYDTFLKRLKTPPSYKPRPEWREELEARARTLAALGTEWKKNPVINENKRNIPSPGANLRLTPKE